MTLVPGTKLGPYEIVAPLGAGGMGEVWRARDSKLGRDVAIKVLPAAFAGEPERLARFEREARLLAALDHPNIARIYGLEDPGGGTPCLVLELAEGEDLSTRIARGALPPEDAVGIALQVARALEHAHERGIVHRDLKPANVKLARDGGVKVLDFGLARAFEGETTMSDSRVSQSPTITRDMTTAGLILGTAAYMSPEQARGRTVDRRADIWSFGVVLYEMLTGVRPFAGETVSETLASVIKDPVDFTVVPAATPRTVRQLLERCLTRDPAERLRDIGEARIVLAAPHADVGAPLAADAGARPRDWRWPALAAALAIAATAAAFAVLHPSRSPRPVRRFRIPIDSLSTTFFAPVALSRDGSSIAYEAGDRLWIRRFDRFEPVAVPGSTKARSPFWSWDQKTLYFSAGKKLWAYTPGGDPPREVCDIPESGEIVGGACAPDSRLVLAIWRGGLYEVPAGGNAARPYLALEKGMVDFHGPTFLPDGHTILLYVHDRGERSAIGIVEGTPPRLERVLSCPNASAVSYSPTGHLLYTGDGVGGAHAVWAVPFSIGSRKVTGPAFRLIAGAAFPSIGEDGTLVAAEDAPAPPGQLVWRRRDGSGETPIGDPQPGLTGPALSPDGGRVAYSAETDGNADIWIQDLVRGTRTRLTSGAAWEGSPVWSGDGRRIFFTSLVGVGDDWIVSSASDGSGTPDTLTHGWQPAVSPDGRNLVYTIDHKGDADLWTRPLAGGGAARAFLATRDDESGPAFSPDGRWLAYMSSESGRNEVYLRRFPEGDERTQVSVHGGVWPRWSRGGDGLYFVSGDTLEVVTVGPGAPPALGLPRPLFATPAEGFDLRSSMSRGAPIDVDADGSRIIGVRRVGAGAARSLLVIECWAEELRRR